MKVILENLGAFHAVVECGGFSAAARRLDTTKSVVSRRVAALEAALGATLLHRSTRRVSLTEAGTAYFERSRDLLAELESAGDDAAASARGLRGSLRIAAPMSFGTLHLARLMSPFLLQHPGLEVAVDLDDRRVDFLAGGYDMAIRIGSVESGNFIARRLGASPIVLVASPGYLAAMGTPQVPADLLRHELLGYAYVAGSQALNFAGRAGRPPLSLRVRPRLVANNGQFMLEAARGGVGIAPVPAWMLLGEEANRGLQPVLADWPLQGSDIYALYARRRQPSLKVKALVEHLAGALGALG